MAEKEAILPDKPPGKGTIENYKKTLTQAGYEGATQITKKAEIKEYYQWCRVREDQLQNGNWSNDTKNTCALQALQAAGLAFPISGNDYGDARLSLWLLCKMVVEKTKWKEETAGTAEEVSQLGLTPNEQISDSLFLYLAVAI